MTGVERLEGYVDAVLSGERVVSQCERAAVERFVRDREDGAYTFDANRAEVACRLIEQMKHTKGRFAGSLFVLDGWQCFVVGNIFGWLRPGTKLRRFRSVYLTMARKQGKTFLAAAILNLLFLADGEPRAECFTVATKRDQAKLCHNEAWRQVGTVPSFKSMVNYRLTSSRMELEDGSTCEPLGSDSKTTDGLNPHAVIYDELHAWSDRHRPLLEKLQSAVGARDNSLQLTITTAGDDDSRLWIEQHDYAEKVLLGLAEDETHFAFIAQIDKDDDPLDPAVWPKANPNLGITVKEEWLAAEAEKARVMPAFLATFTRYYTNRRVSSSNKAIDLGTWMKGGDPLPLLSGAECFVGVDLGWRDDLASIGLVFPLDGDKIAIKSWSFIPEECPHELHREPWAGFINDGSLTVTPGNVTDMTAIHAKLDELKGLYQIKSIAVDPDNARQFGTELISKRYRAFYMKQSCATYNEPLRAFLAMVSRGDVLHGGDSLLAFAADNLTTYTNNASLMRPTKRDSKGKIDPVVSVIMALAERMQSQHRKGGGAPQIR